MEFYQTFVDILEGADRSREKPTQEESRVEIIEEEPVAEAKKDEQPTVKQLARAQFRNLALAEHGKTVAMVKTLAPALINTIRKPQRLLHDDPDYYVAIDCLTNTYYVCYRTLLMIDIDFYKDLSTVDAIISKFQAYIGEHDPDGTELKFKLFKSRNGVHAFLVSRESHYTDDSTVQLELDLASDFYYVVYSYIRGWSVRLNKKVADTSDVLYEYICDVGTAKANDHLLKLVDLHLNLVDVFKGTGVNSMFGN